jgi:hypothetical protein
VAVHELEPLLVGERVEALEQGDVERLLARLAAAVGLLDPKRFELSAAEFLVSAACGLRDDGAVADGTSAVDRERVQRGPRGALREEVLEDVVAQVLGVGSAIKVRNPAEPAGLERPLDRDDLDRVSSRGPSPRGVPTKQRAP